MNGREHLTLSFSLSSCLQMRNRTEYNGSAKQRLKLIVFTLSSHSDLLLLLFLLFGSLQWWLWRRRDDSEFPFLFFRFHHRRDANVAYFEIDERHKNLFQLKSAATTTTTVLAHIDDVVRRRRSRTK